MSKNTIAPTSKAVVRKLLSTFNKKARVLPNTEASKYEASSSTHDDETNTLNEMEPFPNKFTVVYVTTETQTNDALRYIVDGAVGFDTEFTPRRPTNEERLIWDMFPSAGPARKATILGWQIVELHARSPFQPAWNNIGLRLIQLGRKDTVWVVDMWKVRAFPMELRRILESPNIQKVGVGLIKDINIVWDDLRSDMRHVVDVGMMAKLALAERYPKTAYTNLGLKTSVEDVLGYTISKELATSNWAADLLTDEQIRYAALDAIVSLRLHEVLADALERIETIIPAAWYTFNSRMGEAARLKRAPDGSEIAWRTADCTWYVGGKYSGPP
ncbi:ribonuclease H-like domain-containing protein [Mycena epipterygia]|nr:ribonuclease H-like domain-containing protein [Mycena epipterygia]